MSRASLRPSGLPRGPFLSADTPLIRVVGLTHTYHPEGAPPLEALRGLDMQVCAGERVALVGANGSGKSTLARHLNALLLPTSGDVWIDGLNTRDAAHRRHIRALVGMVFQIPIDQIVATVVEEDVAFGPENLGVPRAELRERVRESLERVGMWELRQRPPHLLSPGQQQRVAIAAALAMRPRCLVLDEATAMLDPQGRRELWDLLDRLHADGLTLLYITHDMDDAARAERIIALHQGRVALDAPPARFFGNAERVERLGLGLSTAAELARRLSRRFPTLPAPLTQDAAGLAQALLEWRP